jgi:hypothetical protein
VVFGFLVPKAELYKVNETGLAKEATVHKTENLILV